MPSSSPPTKKQRHDKQRQRYALLSSSSSSAAAPEPAVTIKKEESEEEVAPVTTAATTTTSENNIIKKEESEETSAAQLPSAATTAAAAASVATLPTMTNNNNNDKQSTITVLTFNVAEFKLHLQAPDDGTFDPKQSLIEELHKHGTPTIICLQELPYPSFRLHGYHCVGTTQSHCGYIGLYFSQQFVDTNGKIRRIPPSDLTRFMIDTMASSSKSSSRTPTDTQRITSSLYDRGFPAVLCCVRLSTGKGGTRQLLFVGSCHLEPHKGGSDARFLQLETIHKFCSTMSNGSSDYQLLLAGDCNMRENESKPVEEKFNWKDTWKLAGKVHKQQFTWNSKFNQYHGPDSFGFTCRFDRIYISNGMIITKRGGSKKGKDSCVVDQLQDRSTVDWVGDSQKKKRGVDPTVDTVQNFQLVAKEPKINPKSGKQYFLSDHFGIITTIKI